MPGLLKVSPGRRLWQGAATAVSNRVSWRQANRWTQQQEAQAYEQQQQYYAPPPQYAQPAPAPAPAPAARIRSPN